MTENWLNPTSTFNFFPKNMSNWDSDILESSFVISKNMYENEKNTPEFEDTMLGYDKKKRDSHQSEEERESEHEFENQNQNENQNDNQNETNNNSSNQSIQHKGAIFKINRLHGFNNNSNNNSNNNNNHKTAPLTKNNLLKLQQKHNNNNNSSNNSNHNYKNQRRNSNSMKDLFSMKLKGGNNNEKSKDKKEGGSEKDTIKIQSIGNGNIGYATMNEYGLGLQHLQTQNNNNINNNSNNVSIVNQANICVGDCFHLIIAGLVLCVFCFVFFVVCLFVFGVSVVWVVFVCFWGTCLVFFKLQLL